MKTFLLSAKKIEAFRKHLEEDEKSSATIEKYIRDVNMFFSFSGGKINKDIVIAYKKEIMNRYAVRSVNSMLASINSLFDYLGWDGLKVKSLRVQQQIFCPKEKELTKKEYLRLCKTAESKGNERLSLILQTICGTGIRVSELQFITVEAVKKSEVMVNCKGKRRIVFIVKKLQKKLLRYAAKRGIKSGPVFITKTGKVMSRTNIWREMKSLCIDAHVNPNKVFPHNLRHLFAKLFYSIEKDIAKLADILGHSSINTTRIYIVSNGNEHRQKMERLRLII